MDGRRIGLRATPVLVPALALAVVLPPTMPTPTQAVSTAGAPMTGVPTALPARSTALGSGYTFLMSQPTDPSKPVRWDICQTFLWRFDGGTKQDQRLVQKAFKKITKVNRMRFEQVRSGEAHITIRYQRLGRISGRAGFTAVGQAGGHLTATDGFVNYNRNIRKLSKKRKLHLFLHEQGHVVGLDHVASKRQIMHATVGQRTAYGAGDKAGLRALSSCL